MIFFCWKSEKVGFIMLLLRVPFPRLFTLVGNLISIYRFRYRYLGAYPPIYTVWPRVLISR